MLGRALNGELGNGTTTSSSTPVDVVGLGSGVVEIEAGYLQTCALTGAGGVKCWGDNTYGGLGNGTRTSSSVPLDVTGLTSGVAAISSNGGGACALMTAGSLECWGGGYGALLTGTVNGSLTPVAISGLEGVSAIAVGGSHACAIVTGGAVKCWGANQAGELGNGSTKDSGLPVSVTGLTRYIRPRRRRLLHRLRPHQERRSQVLGLQRMGRDRRRHDDGPVHTH